jgi:hypothetical protein
MNGFQIRWNEKPYWENPEIYVEYPMPESCRDPIVAATHGGEHVILYDPALPVHRVAQSHSLQVLLDWINESIDTDVDVFLSDSEYLYNIGNMVKLNLWINDIRSQGIVKPWLVFDPDEGNDWLCSGTGESRLRCLELLPQIQHVSAFVSTHARNRDRYPDLVEVESFDHFAKCCRAQHGQSKFVFKMTDATAAFGLYWYEYNTSWTQPVMPTLEWCRVAISGLLHQDPGFRFRKQWFSTLQPWQEWYDLGARLDKSSN